MSTLFASGRVVDLIIIFMLLEVMFLVVYYRKTGRGIPPIYVWGNLFAGLFLLLALRSALAGLEWIWIALCLSLALFGHVADLSVRWRR